MDLREPWYVPQDLRDLERQLAREVLPGHVLAGTPVRAMARRQDCDDVLFELLDGSSRVAVVHLTFSTNVSSDWPHTTLFSNYSAWLTERMVADSESFDA